MKIKLLFFLSLLISCAINEKNHLGDKNYVGDATIKELFSEYPIFKTNYESYTPENLNNFDINDLEIVIFFGTWCHDSKRELPRALKIFNNIGIQSKNIELIAVGLDKKEPLGRAAKLNLMYTPTLIFFRGSKEIGRIIEKPVISLEKDIELIISSI